MNRDTIKIFFEHASTMSVRVKIVDPELTRFVIWGTSLSLIFLICKLILKSYLLRRIAMKIKGIYVCVKYLQLSSHI